MSDGTATSARITIKDRSDLDELKIVKFEQLFSAILHRQTNMCRWRAIGRRNEAKNNCVQLPWNRNPE